VRGLLVRGPRLLRVGRVSRRRRLLVPIAAGVLFPRRPPLPPPPTPGAAEVSRHNKTDTCDDDERGWLQLGVGNCPFVTRTAVWVHCAGIRLSLEYTAARPFEAGAWQAARPPLGQRV